MSKKQTDIRPCEKSFPFTTRLIADMYGFKPDTVRKVRRGARSESTEMGETIATAQLLLNHGISKLIEEVKRTVPFNH